MLNDRICKSGKFKNIGSHKAMFAEPLSLSLYPSVCFYLYMLVFFLNSCSNSALFILQQRQMFLNCFKVYSRFVRLYFQCKIYCLSVFRLLVLWMLIFYNGYCNQHPQFRYYCNLCNGGSITWSEIKFANLSR